jgi:hypothetical protein
MEAIDVWRAAKLLVDRYGDGAAPEAARRIAEQQSSGDTVGAAVWGQIHAAILELQAPLPVGEKAN